MPSCSLSRGDEEDEGRVAKSGGGFQWWEVGRKAGPVAGYVGCSPSMLLAALGLEEACCAGELSLVPKELSLAPRELWDEGRGGLFQSCPHTDVPAGGCACRLMTLMEKSTCVPARM